MSFSEMKLEKFFLKIIDGINDKSKKINNKIESNFNILLNITQILYSLNGMIVIVKHK
jgi:archaellum component FlaG (FlaF/FlaG flagellin family)